MSEEELHAFGINVVLPYVRKAGITVQSVTRDPKLNPQIVGTRWDAPAFIAVRTACYPKKGELTPDHFDRLLHWADKHDGEAFLASVGVVCVSYPDKTRVTNSHDAGLAIRHGGFYIAYTGLVILTTSDLA